MWPTRLLVVAAMFFPSIAASQPAVAPAKRLEVRLLALGTDRPVAGVRIALGEVRGCTYPRGGAAPTCTPARARRLVATTDRSGTARFTLPPPRSQAVSEPVGLHYAVTTFQAPGFFGKYPIDEGAPVTRQTRLEDWQPLAPGWRVTYWLVPPTALRVRTASDARTASAQEGATARSVSQRGLLWLVQWETPAGQGRCAAVDALEGGVQILGTEDCVP